MVELNTERELTTQEIDELFDECFAMADGIELSPELQEAAAFDALMNRETGSVAKSMAESLNR